MLKVLILICSSGLSPADCRIDTASDVISGPEVASVMACGLGGQTLVAQTAGIGRHPGDYVKIACIRPEKEVEARRRLRAAAL